MSKNPFALLSDEGDTSDDERRPPVSAPAPAVASSEPKQPRKQSRDQSRPTTSVISQVNRRDNARGDGEVDGNDSRGATRGGARGSARGNARARGGRGGGRGAPGGSRPDRHSATGIHDSDKKEHQGWGGDDGARELDDEAQGLNDARAETSTAAAPGSKPNGGWAAAPVAVSTTDDAWATAPTDTAVSAPSSTPAAAAPAPAAPEPEPEDNTKTLEEYLAERMASTTKLGGDLQTRKANEGADESQWRDGVALLRKGAEEDSFYVGQKEHKARARKTKEGKTFIEVEPSSERPRDSSRGRGGRGGDSRGGGGRGGADGFRGGRGRGAPRGGGGGFRGARGGDRRGQSREVNLEDATAFPSLA